MSRDTLVVFTHGAPYANVENAFFMPELPLLAQAFKHVILMPDRKVSEASSPTLPRNVSVDFSIAMAMEKSVRQMQFHALMRLKFIKDFMQIRSLRDFKLSLLYCGEVVAFKSGFNRFVRKAGLDVSRTLFYTFWLTAESSGLAELSKQDRRLRFVSRAHGYDLYDHRTGFRSRYYRDLTFKMASGVYCCSREGAEYLKKSYPRYPAAIRYAYLGLDCSASTSNQNWRPKAGVLRLITVANPNPVKQIPRFVEVLSSCLTKESSIQVEYDIIGSGTDDAIIKKLAKEGPENLRVNFLGPKTNADVLNRYREMPYDFFVLPSRSEGLSVAVMEAMCRGIPAIVTDVGGMRELVIDGETGYVMEPDFTADAFGRILELIKTGCPMGMRVAAVRHIQENFDVNKVRRDFVRELRYAF